MGSNEIEELIQQSSNALKAKQYPVAESSLRRAVGLLEKDGAPDETIATHLEQLASIHVEQEKFEIAANEYIRVLALRSKFLPPNDFQMIRVQHSLGRTYFADQNYESAEAAFRQSLSFSETRPESPAGLALCLYELGFLLYYVGRYAEGETYLLRALPLFESNKGPSHPETIETLERIALTYKNDPKLGKDPGPYFRRAVEAATSEQKETYQYVANLCRYAEYLADSVRVTEAEGAYTELLTLLNKRKDVGESELNWIVSDCIKYFKKQGKTELVAYLIDERSAHKSYLGMVDARLQHAEQTLPPDDPEYAEALFVAGNAVLYDGDDQRAEELLTRALASYTESYGENSEQVVHALNRVCVVKRVRGKLEEAESAISRALELAQSSFTETHLFPRTLETFAILRSSQERFQEAAELEERALTETERLCGFPSFAMAESLYRSGSLFLHLGKLTRAEECIERAISIMDEVEGLSESEKSDYIMVRGQILEASGRIEEGRAEQKRAQDILERERERCERDNE